MISWVDIEGAGVDLTRIESEGFTSSTSATLVAAENSELRSLTIENTGGANLAYGIFSDSDGFSVRNVKVIASGGTLFNRGIVIRGGPLNSYIQGCSVVVDSQIASAPSDGINVLANSGDINLHLHDVAIMAESTIDEAITGIRQEAGTDYTNIITATGLSINANNTNSSWGFAIISQRVGSILNLFNSSVSGIGQPGAGIYMLAGATVNISNAIIQGEECGIWLQTSSTSGIAEVDNSIVVGGVYSILTSGESGHHVNIGSSLLDGDTLIASGNTITCVNSYDESYTNVNGFDSCP